MKQCRICLEHKNRHLCSVFKKDQGISYANMITALTKIKIAEDACTNNIICSQCCEELRRSFDFVKQIERSDKVLNKHLKIIYFNNIEDIKCKLIEEDVYNEKQTYLAENKVIDNFICHLRNGCDNILYSNTTIKKVMSSLKNNEERSRDSPISNFHKSIKHELNETSDFHDVDDIFYDDLVECEDESKNEDKTKKIQTKDMKFRVLGEKKITKKGFSKRVRIKPVILEDIRVIRTKYPTVSRKRSNRDQKARRKRMDMCPHCGIMFSKISTHMMVHIGEKKYKCSDCRKAFFTSKQLSTHQRNHLAARTFKCDHCVAVFNNKHALQRHMVSHIDDRQHICLVCNKGFKRKHSLLRHSLIHNSAAKSLKCELCNMSFLLKQNLRHHMRVHTGERPFKCEICSQPYSYKCDFNRHCLKKHGICLKQRSVHVMTEEVLKKEQELRKDLMLRIQGVIKDGEPLNPFKGPQAALAFEHAVKALGTSEMKAMM